MSESLKAYLLSHGLALEVMVDHQIQNVSLFFVKLEGETHQKRYKHYPDLLAVGWMDAPDARAESVFRHLVQRNAVNFYAKNSVCGVVIASHSS